MARGANASITTAVRAETGDFERKMKKADAHNKRFFQGAINASRGMSKAASIGGAGFSSLSAGISAAQASGESFESAMVSVGSSVAAAFAAGGPLGAGLALVSVGFGTLLGGINQSEKAAKEAAKTFEASFKKAEEGAKRARDELAKLEVRILELEHSLSGDALNMDRFNQSLSIKEQIGVIEEAERAYNEAAKPANDMLRERAVILEKMKGTEDNLLESESRRLHEIEKLLPDQQRSLEAQRQHVEAEKRRLDAMKRIFALTAQEEEQKAAIAAQTKEVEKTQREIVEHVKLEAEWQLDVTKALQQKAALVDRYVKSAERAAAAAKREQDRVASGNQALDRELRLLQAGNDVERERIRLEEWRNDQLEKGYDAEKVALVYAEKMKALLEESRQESEAKAAAETATTQQMQQQEEVAKRVKRLTSPREGFVRAPGTGGLFGFGTVTQGLGWTQGGGSRRRRRAPRPGGSGIAAAAGGSSSDAPNLPDPTPIMLETAKSVSELPGYVEKIVRGAEQQRDEVKSAVAAIGLTVSKEIGKAASDRAALRAEVRSAIQSITRANRPGVAGGG